LPAKVETRTVGQAHIQDDQLWLLLQGEGHPPSAGITPGGLEARLFQAIHQALSYGRVIFNQENMGG
jgi:anti-sigma-K factor RskA